MLQANVELFNDKRAVEEGISALKHPDGSAPLRERADGSLVMLYRWRTKVACDMFAQYVEYLRHNHLATRADIDDLYKVLEADCKENGLVLTNGIVANQYLARERKRPRTSATQQDLVPGFVDILPSQLIPHDDSVSNKEPPDDIVRPQDSAIQLQRQHPGPISVTRSQLELKPTRYNAIRKLKRPERYSKSPAPAPIELDDQCHEDHFPKLRHSAEELPDLDDVMEDTRTLNEAIWALNNINCVPEQQFFAGRRDR